jgi:hypothetical protein
MTITELGAIGELVGGVAVIGSLIYLAAQIRQNTRAMRSTTHQTVVDSVLRTVESISDHPDVAELVARSAAIDVEFSPMEQVRFDPLANRRFTVYESIFLQRSEIAQEMWEGWDAGYREVVANPSMKRFWDKAKFKYHRAFRDYLDVKVYAGARMTSEQV